MKEKKFASKNELLTYVTKILYDNCNNSSLIKQLNLAFGEKGLNLKTPSMLTDMDSTVNVSNITELELITIIDTLYKFRDEKVLNPNMYFSDLEMDNYETYKPTPQDLVDTMVFKDGIKVGEQQWVFYMSLRDCYLYKKNMLVRYNIQSQRKSNYKEIGTKGFGVDDAALDKEAVFSIKEDFKAGKFTPNLVTFNVIIQEGKIAQFKEVGRDVYVTPNYDRSSPNTTYADCIDGFHRVTGGAMAYKECLEEGIELEGGLLLSLVRMTLEEARNYVAREFKRSSTNQEWLDSIEENDYTKMADRIIKNISIGSGSIKELVGTTYDDVRYRNKITHRNVFVDAIKSNNMLVNNLSTVVYDSLAIGNSITLMLGYLNDKYFGSDYKNMLRESYLLDCNMFAAYITITYRLLKYDDREMTIIDFAEKLYLLNEGYKDMEKNLFLKNKNYSSSKISDYFTKILKI